MKRVLILCQNLDISGSSEGMVSNAFVVKYLKMFPKHQVDVKWISKIPKTDEISNQLNFGFESIKIPHRKFTWIENKLNAFLYYTFGYNLKDILIINRFKKAIKKININAYDQIFVRSGGLDFYLIRALKGNPYINKMSIYFHDPYPACLYPGSNSEFNIHNFRKIKEMRVIVNQAKNVFSPSKLLSNDLGFLYSKRFHTLPHQFDHSIFTKTNLKMTSNLDDKYNYIIYHGAIQHNRCLGSVLSAFQELTFKNQGFNNFKFIIRASGKEANQLKSKYQNSKNIIFNDLINTYASYVEQKNYASLSIILETNGDYSNILGGKTPMLVSIDANMYCLTSNESELKRLLHDKPGYFSNYNKSEIKKRLKFKLEQIVNKNIKPNPLKSYFSDKEFKNRVTNLLK